MIGRFGIASKLQTRWIFHYKKSGNIYFLKAKPLQVSAVRSLQTLCQVMVLTSKICRSLYPIIFQSNLVEIPLWMNAAVPWIPLIKALLHVAATKAVLLEGTSLGKSTRMKSFCPPCFRFPTTEWKRRGPYIVLPLWSSQDLNPCDTKLLNTTSSLSFLHSDKPLDRVQFAAGLQVEVKADPTAGDKKIPSRASQDSHSHRSLLGTWQGLVLTQGFHLVPVSISWLEYPM